MDDLQKRKRRKRWKRYQKLRRETPLLKLPKDYAWLKRYFNNKGGKKRGNIPQYLLELSPVMNFNADIGEMVRFSERVEYAKKLQTKRLQIYHKKARNISVAALLYIVAQIDYLVNLKSRDRETRLKYSKKLGIDEHNEKLKYLLHKIGYWNYFGIHKPYKISKSIEDILFLKIHTNNSDRFDYLNAIKKFVQAQTNLFDTYEKEYKFDDAVKEALGNALEHAYPKDFNIPGKSRGKWWICGFYDKKDEFLEIIFYDYGVGIRESVKRNLDEKADRSLWDRIIDGLTHDGELIKIALTAELSKYKRYKDRDRGKGFKRFRDFAKALGHDCSLVVVSGNGVVRIELSKSEEKIHTEKINGKIDGMLIKWQIWTGGKNDDHQI